MVFYPLIKLLTDFLGWCDMSSGVMQQGGLLVKNHHIRLKDTEHNHSVFVKFTLPYALDIS